MNWILSVLFGCAHSRTTFPLTPVRGAQCYCCCLDCGREFEYSWSQMRIGKEVKA